MDAAFFILFTAYIVCGILTMRLLVKKEWAVALGFYAFTFAVIALYFPYCCSCVFLSRKAGYLTANYIPIFSSVAEQRIPIDVPFYCSFLVAAIGISAFLVGSVLVAAVFTIREICTVLRNRAAWYLRRSQKKQSVLHRTDAVPAPAVRYAFCRFNC